MEFILIEKLKEISGIDLYLLLGAVAIVIALIVVAIITWKDKGDKPAIAERKVSPVRAVVFGALCISLSFALSYIKLFSMPLGGSITLCSMLPVMLYAGWFGPVYGFTAAFAYSLLQVVQGAQIVHWVQFILDYFVAFTCLGIVSVFHDRKNIIIGIAIAGMMRMLVSTISGAVFFASYAGAAGWTNAWTYSLVYNGMTIGVDTFICAIVYVIPPVRKGLERLREYTKV